ncbi:porin [Ramlibacter tataouinensis]|nr:porin [Ramlibacter tataouinensis]
MTKMKLISLVPLSMAGAALAQVGGTGGAAVTTSNVSLFGVVDIAASWGKGDVADSTRLVQGANTQSRVGFRGVEDLGGGVGAGFWLEAGVNADNGTGAASNTNNQLLPAGATPNNGAGGLTFNRRSTVSLLSRFGELRLGRDYVATYRNRDQVDPFTTNGVGGNVADQLNITPVTGVRASNMIGYFLPGNLGGFFGEAQYFMGENPDNTVNDKDGSGYQARLGWASGPFGIAAAYGVTRYATTATIGDVTSWNVGGHWDFGFLRLMGGWYDDQMDSLVKVNAEGYLVGAVMPIGAGELKASFSSYETDAATNPTARKIAVGYVHNMSKRTAAYVTYAHLENRGSAAASLAGSITAPGKNSDGIDVGLKHSF